jgi:hypothetical protein
VHCGSVRGEGGRAALTLRARYVRVVRAAGMQCDLLADQEREALWQLGSVSIAGSLLAI